MNKKNHDSERKIMLGRLQNRFNDIIDCILKDGMRYPELASKKAIAERVGLDRALLTKLTSIGKNGRYGAELSNTYLMPFIVGGLISVKDIYDGKVDISAKERGFWERAEIQERINKIRDMGFDIVKILDAKIEELDKMKATISSSKSEG